MQIKLSLKQLRTLADLVSRRIDDIDAESDPKHSLEELKTLLARLQQSENSGIQTEQWQGYAETRKVPANPLPAS